MFPFCCNVKNTSNRLERQIYFSPKKPIPKWDQSKGYNWTIATELKMNDSPTISLHGVVTPEYSNDSPTISLHRVVTPEYSAKELSRKPSDSLSVVPSENRDVISKIKETSRSCHTPFECNVLVPIPTYSFSTYIPVPMTKILPHLYLGTYEDATNESQLKAKKITHILTLIGKRSTVDFVLHKQIPMHDRGISNLKLVLEKASKFIEQGQRDGNSILVHCQWGQNRSPTVVTATLMENMKMTLYRAHKMVKKLRPVVQINKGYAKQLLALEKKIFAKNSLPFDWMEPAEIDISTGDVQYKYENLNSAQHREMFD